MSSEPILTAKHYEAIGEVIVTWARLESHMIRVLQALLKAHFADAVAVFWHMQYRERKNRLVNLVYLNHEDKNDPIRKEFDTLMKRMDSAYDARNVAAHSVWFKGRAPDAIKPLIIQAKGADLRWTGRGLPPTEYTAVRLHKEAEKISRLAEDFKDFFSTHFNARFVHKNKNQALN